MRRLKEPLPPVLMVICTVRRFPVHRHEIVPSPSSGAGVDGLYVPKDTGVVETVQLAWAAKTAGAAGQASISHAPAAMARDVSDRSRRVMAWVSGTQWCREMS